MWCSKIESPNHTRGTHPQRQARGPRSRETSDPFLAIPTTIPMSGHLSTLSDEQLAEMARAGHREALETLCDRYLPCVYNRLRALLPPEAVEDVTQEVFIAAVRGIGRYRAQSLFRTWIAGITRHKVADYYRRRSRQPQVVPLCSEADCAQNPDPWQERSLVRLALQRLPIHYQEILLLRFADGMRFGQIADALGISLEAAKSRYRRAVVAVAREIGPDHGRPVNGPV